MSCINPQTCFASIASLNLQRSLKPKTTVQFWLVQNLPLLPMDFSFITPLTPPKFPNKHFNFLAETQRKTKTTHSEGRNSLDYSFQQHFFARLRKQFLLPPLKFSPHPIFDVIQTSFLISSHHRRQSQILLVFFDLGNTQQIFYNLFY